MAETTNIDYPRGVTFETVWVTIQENAEKSRQEHEKWVKEFHMYQAAERQRQKEERRRRAEEDV